MTDRSPNLDMPFLLPSQAQKHVTHNEALQQLDALVQLAVIAFDSTTPPPVPEPGDCYALGSGATGDWAGNDGALAYQTDSGWIFITPGEGWRAWGMTENELRVFQGSSWNVPPTGQLSELGINTSADATNRLAVASDAVLLTHDGSGHQVKINKASESDTASLLYQTNWTGHAEIGLTGGNDLSVKVSPDGTAWTTALQVDRSTGHVGGAAVQADATDTTTGRLMRADYGYGPGNLLGSVAQSGGVPTGAVIESGSNANGSYTRWADGTQICWATKTYADVDITTATGGAFRSQVFAETFPVAFVTPPTFNLSGTREDGAWDVWAVVTAGTNSTFNALHLKLTSDNAQSRRIDYVAIGRWY